MDLKEKQKLFILFWIFGILGLIIYYNLLLRPVFSNFITMNREYYSLRSRVKVAENMIANEANIRKQYESLGKEALSLEKRLPNQDQIASLLEAFSGVAESSGVKILRIKPLEAIEDISKTEKTSSFYSEFPILIEARAGYHQGGEFVNKLETMERFIRIEDIDIRGRSGDPRHHDIKLRVITYVAQ